MAVAFLPGTVLGQGDRLCRHCDVPFHPRRKTSAFCSRRCSNLGRPQNGTRGKTWTWKAQSPKRRVFSATEKALAIREFTTGMKTLRDVSALLGCNPITASKLLKECGVDWKLWRAKKISVGALRSFQQGRVVPAACSYGKKVPITTPFQGVLVARSTAEERRASQLTESGRAWFYELKRFALSDGTTYLPDFWVSDLPVEEALAVLGTHPSGEQISQFLSQCAYRVEDVKGYWEPGHTSYAKIQRFREDWPGVPFDVVVSDRKGGWTWQ